MDNLARDEISVFIQNLAKKIKRPVSIYLLGGSALCFLGNKRRTVDVDLTVLDARDELISDIEILAENMKIEVEIVPIEEFIPLPVGAQQRHQKIAQYGCVELFVYDPYSIALSKLARGFETDIQDVLFLINEGWIEIKILAHMVQEALPLAWDFDIDPSDLKTYWNEVKRLAE